MKKILLIMLAFVVMPSLVNAQSKKQIIKRVEQKLESTVKQQALRSSSSVAKTTAKKAAQASAKKAAQASAKKIAVKVPAKKATQSTAKKPVAKTTAKAQSQSTAEKAGQVMEKRAMQARQKMHVSPLSPEEHEMRADAFLRAQLFGDTPIFTSTAYEALRNQMNALDVSLANKTLHLSPAGRLSKESRRINTGLAQYMLNKESVKEQIVKGYALSDAFLEGYYLRRIYPYLSKPSFQADQSGHLYRGIYMTVDELAATLKDGFLTKMNTWSTGARKGERIVSFSTSTGEAMSYIFQTSGNHPNGIGVVFEVDRDLAGLEYWEDPILNSTKTIYHCYKDVPASRIRNVYVYGEYGLESLVEILIKAQKGKVKSNQQWVSVFDGGAFGGGFAR